jgi:hypothetical protein
MTPAGFPHSDTRGSQDACSSPRLFAACHVLHRLPAPRHPPCALTALDQFPGPQRHSRSRTAGIVSPGPPPTTTHLRRSRFHSAHFPTRIVKKPVDAFRVRTIDGITQR